MPLLIRTDVPVACSGSALLCDLIVLLFFLYFQFHGGGEANKVIADVNRGVRACWEAPWWGSWQLTGTKLSG